MSYIMVDVEADGPIPSEYSMVCFGAVVVEPSLERTFYRKLRPITDRWMPEALAVSGFSREETEAFPAPEQAVASFSQWLSANSRGRPMFVSDNNGFDWQYINYYFHRFEGTNPFGFSSTNLGSLYKGFVRDTRKNFEHLRQDKIHPQPC